MSDLTVPAALLEDVPTDLLEVLAVMMEQEPKERKEDPGPPQKFSQAASWEAPRIVNVLGGGDWTDASVDCLSVPLTMDLDAEARIWRDEGHRQHRTFAQYLALRGCEEADVEVVEE